MLSQKRSRIWTCSTHGTPFAKIEDSKQFLNSALFHFIYLSSTHLWLFFGKKFISSSSNNKIIRDPSIFLYYWLFISNELFYVCLWCITTSPHLLLKSSSFFPPGSVNAIFFHMPQPLYTTSYMFDSLNSSNNSLFVCVSHSSSVFFPP